MLATVRRSSIAVLLVLAALIAGCGGESQAERRANELIPPQLKHAEQKAREEEAEGKAALKERKENEVRVEAQEALEEKRRGGG
jgi:hypothetical protein